MKTKDIKKGISLIVLIITIIVVIILAAVVILALSKNNPIESAKEARFKEDVRTFQDELAMTVSKEYAQSGGHRDTKISTSNFDIIKEYIPSFSEKYRDKLIIEEDELVYTSKVSDSEKTYLISLNIKRISKYCANGIILYLDGIKNTRNGHSNTTTVWEDLSGNNNDFIKLDSASNAIWSENSYVGDATNRTLYLSKAILNGATECTVEVCYDVPRLYNYYWVFQSRDSNYSANGFQFFVGSTGRGVTAFESYTTYNALSSFIKVSEVNKRTMGFVVDNTNITFADNASFYTEESKQGLVNSIVQRNKYSIGSNYPWGGNTCGCLFKGNIYSIRVYNRKLSEEELRNNYEVDKARFDME